MQNKMSEYLCRTLVDGTVVPLSRALSKYYEGFTLLRDLMLLPRMASIRSSRVDL